MCYIWYSCIIGVTPITTNKTEIKIRLKMLVGTQLKQLQHQSICCMITISLTVCKNMFIYAMHSHTSDNQTIFFYLWKLVANVAFCKQLKPITKCVCIYIYLYVTVFVCIVSSICQILVLYYFSPPQNSCFTVKN